MTKEEQIDFLSHFKNDYYEYGMDVIKDRALPDVRDGLKPVHRSIMYEMLNSKITSKSQTVKVARITGNVIGKWHPHGDKAVEDALAGLTTDWKNSMSPIEIKGNNGSVFGDTHAAGRYIEARLTPTGDAYGSNLKKGIVEYEPNFDDTEEKPVILPAQLPYLLINGTEGIAVGVSSSIPTHNPNEVVNAFISFVKNQKQSIKDLMKIMPGPDFPTAGEIINKSELPEIYEKGLGRIRVRGKIRYDKKDHTLHVYEIPFTSSGSMDNLVSEITVASMETTNSKGRKIPPKILGITDVKDHSGKDGIDITIKLKRDVNPDAMIKELYAKTRLETTLKYDFSALNEKRLRRYGLKQYFKEYLTFQHEILINEFTVQKKAMQKRIEIISGLLILQQFIDEIIASAKNANGKSELNDVLQKGIILNGVPKKYHKRIKQFKFTPAQAEYISNLPIYKINKLDYAKLIDEGKQIQKDMEYADSIINNVTKRKNLIIKRHKDELKKLKGDKFKRKTNIIDDEIAKPSKLEIPESPLFVSMDKYHYIRIEEKSFANSIETTNKSRLGFIDNQGICWNLHLENVKTTKNKGVLLDTLISPKNDIVGMTTNINKDDLHYGLFIFKDGNIKLTDMRKYMTKSKTTKVSSGKSKHELIKYVDVPINAVGITINNETYKMDEFSINNPNGHGKKMLSNTDDVTIDFVCDDTLLPKKELNGYVHFDGSDTLYFDWDNIDTNQYMFSIEYKKLLETKVLFVHKDGRAKIVDGSQFKVTTKRKSIQADKKGVESLYIGEVPETLIGKYTDGTQKRIKTSLLSHQGKTGNGIRAFYSDKHTLKNVEDGVNSKLPCVSLATQPK